ncbi:MAG: hypothetical protein PWR13_976 [Archaeoglobi archaeon]|nr:hypothetical protein [Candidatus Mnemosynella bozhongmuii]MDI3502262.1 hypothetical protein [Archaeoglobi archaeon]MDK2781948.1 hypothetical protein [Archaeoglobi archaeon]
MRIGIITDGKYGERAYQNLSRFFEVRWIYIPMPVSQIIDDDLDIELPECDLYISYHRHPDVVLSVAERGKPMILGVSFGKGFHRQISQMNPRVITPKTMCMLEDNTGIDEIDEYAKHFGHPEFRVEMKGRRIEDIEILRESPCTSTREAVREILGKEVNEENLNRFALSVCYNCRAPRFGRECDKEVAGANHLLSLIDAILKNELPENLERELLEMRKKVEGELKRRLVEFEI